MSQSARFLELKKRMTVLRHHLLPAEFSPTGSYSDRVLDRTRSYRVLVCAECEAFLEERCLGVVTAAIRNWKIDKQARHTLMALLARCGPDADSNLALRDCIGQAGSSYHHLIRANHGIRESNLISVLQPVGIELPDLNPTWLATVDSFGVARGEVAHRSIGAQKPIDPLNELTIVKQVRDGFGELDRLLNKLA